MANITITIDEEYGYRHWMWYTGMTEAELIQWWETMETVEPQGYDGSHPRCYFIDPSKSLPGTVTQLDDDLILEHIRTHTYICHIHEDDDSYLFNKETNKLYFHKGYKNG